MGGYDVIYNGETAGKMFGSLGIDFDITKYIVYISFSAFVRAFIILTTVSLLLFIFHRTTTGLSSLRPTLLTMVSRFEECSLTRLPSEDWEEGDGSRRGLEFVDLSQTDALSCRLAPLVAYW